MADVVLESLDEDECLRLIAPGGIGRLVYAGRYDLTVLPVNYKMHNGAILFRTAQAGATDEDLRTGIAHAEYRVAFEVDDIDYGAREGWSVLVQGPAHHLDSDGGARRRGGCRASSPGRAGNGSTSSGSPRPGSPAGGSGAARRGSPVGS